MGSTLSEPVTTKETSSCENDFVKVGASCMQGWRMEMEDAHTHLLSLANDKEACFFAVYDGHCGAKVSKYAGNNLHEKIVSHPAFKKGEIVEAIKQSFLDIDADMLKDDELKETTAGSTAVVTLIKNEKIFCGNAGDSRAIASVAGAVQQLSFDHKPDNKDERKRIVAAGGYVSGNRVKGSLALSRALGDFEYKMNKEKPDEEQMVTAYPDVIVKDITPDHEFIVLACDGIWDVMTNEEVVDFVRTRIATKMEPEQICEELMTHCLAPESTCRGLGEDNMTVILVCLLQGDSYEELANKCNRVHSSTQNGNLILLSESSPSKSNGDCQEENNKPEGVCQQDCSSLDLRDCNVPSNSPIKVSLNSPDKTATSLPSSEQSESSPPMKKRALL